MIIGVLLVLLGVLLIISSPIFGFLPGLLLIVVGIVIGILGFLGRGIGAILGLGRRRRD
jgi:hypothetical protein